jgi:hypothetical protein
MTERIVNPPPGVIDPLFPPDAVKRFSFASGDAIDQRTDLGAETSQVEDEIAGGENDIFKFVV